MTRILTLLEWLGYLIFVPANMYLVAAFAVNILTVGSADDAAAAQKYLWAESSSDALNMSIPWVIGGALLCFLVDVIRRIQAKRRK